ncbi:MAG: pseudaminic acid synthase [Alphaproteobacteria bacterium]|nr:pseudaminic acid synthase [Alphaproteobacteria bacterium]|tara:strand:+ start:1088 stop:2134 length:1047 start_codon:yes stop_codon:yes gene_type:complete
MKSVEIAGRSIGPDAPPFVIAELSGNHNGELERALTLVDAACEAGADAIKLQTYTADTITIAHSGPGFDIEDGPWAGRTLYDLYREAHTPWDWHAPLFERARERGLIMFSSPFDATAVALLEELGAPAYKIASFELIDLPLIRTVAATGKPMIMSTGMADFDEIAEAVSVAQDAGADDIALLHCTSGYPTPANESDLRTIPHLADSFGLATGLSDHTSDIGVAVASIALGACIVEKHLTLNRADGGPDAGFSMEPDEFATLCRNVRLAWEALGRVRYEKTDAEMGNVQFRRSLYVVEDIPEGGVLNETNMRSIRPGFGLAPKHYDQLLGKVVKQAVKRGTPLDWDMFD